MNLKNKKILVTGGTGMIGHSLIPMLLEKGVKRINVVSLDDIRFNYSNVWCYDLDLTQERNCHIVCNNMDIIFNLIGIKTSPKIMKENPADIFEKYLQFTNIIQAAKYCNVEWFMYTSSIGVYNPAQLNRGAKEVDMWDVMPSKNDWYGGWGKRIGEMLLQSYKEQDGWGKFSIVRPANVFGAFDNFNPKTSMVIPSLIKRMVDGENPLNVWGDGSQIRDFIHADDVAKGMIYAVENEINTPINLGSGKGVSIKEVVDIIKLCINSKIKIEWDTSKPTGDDIRILDMFKANELGIPETSYLKDSLIKTIDWYMKNQDLYMKRYEAI